MVSVQERLKLKRAQIDAWSVREQLCLASAVLRSGDQNWMSVSRALRTFGDAGRPTDWFSQKSCAVQYSNLLENVETPKRKKRTDKGDASLETPSESIARRLTEERIEELKKLLNEDKREYAKLKDDILKVKSGLADNNLGEFYQEIEEEKQQKIRKTEAHEKWLKDREERKIELERAWKPLVGVASPHKRKHQQRIHRRNSSHSEPSSEAEYALDSPLSEPLNVDVIGEENLHEAAVELKPSHTPTSPLLTSLLKSPSPAPASQGSSILHSAITSNRGASPTISSLLSTAPGVPGPGNVSVTPPTTVSSSLKDLVSSAISADHHHHHQTPHHNPSPAAGAPTLSMLLELPPSLPGKPLPELPSVIKTTISPSTVSAIVSAASSIPSSEKLISVRAITTTAPSDVNVAKHGQSPLAAVEMAPSIQQDLKIADGVSKDVEILSVDSTQNSIDTSLLANDNKEELIEEVLIEEVVVNDDSVITTELLTTQITNVVVANDEEDIKMKDCKKEQLKLHQFIDMSEPADVIPLPKEDVISKSPDIDNTSDTTTIVVNEISDVEMKSDKGQSVNTIIENASQELVSSMVNEEGSSLRVIPESEVELSSGTVAEVIEITEDQEATIQTEVVGECEPCIEALANMEVIILDKMQELSEVEIVEDMKELGCEVVEVVMGDQEKVEVLKEETEESILDDVKSEVTCLEACPIISKSTVQTMSIENDCKLNVSYDASQSSSEKDSQETVGEMRPKVNETYVTDNLAEDTEVICDDENIKEVMQEEEQRKDYGSPVHNLEEPFEKCLKENVVSLPISGENTIKTEGEVDEDSNNSVQEMSNLKENQNSFLNVQDITRKKDKSMPSTVLEESLSKPATDINEFLLQKNEIIPSNVTSYSSKSDIKTADSGKKDAKKEASMKIESVCGVSKSSSVAESSQDRLSDETTNEEIITKQVKLADVKEGKEVLGKTRQEISGHTNQGNSKEKASNKDVSRKELSKVHESNKKLVRGNVLKEEREKVGESSKREMLNKEIEREASPKEMKNVLTSTIDSSREEGHFEASRKSDVSKETKKKESSASKSTQEVDLPSRKDESPFTETILDRGNRELTKQDSEDVPKKEELKQGRVDRRESVKDEMRKKSHNEFVKSQRKVLDQKDSEVSASNIERILKEENEFVKSDYKERGKEKSHLDSTPIDEDDKNFLQILQKEGKYTDSKIKSILEDDKISTMIQKEGREYYRGFSTKFDALDVTDEKIERRTMLRAETPSTEDDKTNDAEPQKSLGRKRLTAVSVMDSVPNSPASTTDEEREYKSWKKSIMLLYGRLATHKFASLFLRPITDDQAPGYSSVVHRPIDLLTIKKNIETGVIRTTLEFQRDVMLMFLNSIMYNKSSHFVHKMALQMQSEGMQHIQDYLTTQMLVQVAGDSVPIRRETRTTEANKQREMLSNTPASAGLEEGENNLVNKRKRITGSESERSIKKKKGDEGKADG